MADTPAARIIKGLKEAREISEILVENKKLRAENAELSARLEEAMKILESFIDLNKRIKEREDE